MSKPPKDSILKMTICQWNIDGLQPNLYSLNSLIEDFSPDVINLQETNLKRAKASSTAQDLDETYTINVNCKDDQAILSEQLSKIDSLLFKSKGTASLWKIDSPLQTAPVATPTFQMSANRITLERVSILNVSCYFPTTGNEKDHEYLEYLEMLATFLKKELREDEELIITADFNIHLEDTEKPSSNMRIEAYKEFLIKYNLMQTRPDGDTFYCKKEESTSSSKLDWIVHSKGIKVDEIKTIKMDELAHSSDHLPVVMKISLKFKKQDKDDKTEEEETNKNFNKTKKIDWEKEVDKNLYKVLLHFFITRLPSETWSLPNQLKLKVISDQMNLAAMIAKKKYRHKRSIDKKSRGMIKAEIKLTKINTMISAIEKKMMKTDQDEIAKAILLKERQKARKVLRKEQGLWSKKRVTNQMMIMEDLIKNNTTKKLFEEIKKLNGRRAAGRPDYIEVYGKRYSDKEVIRGFEVLTKTRSRNDRLLKADPYYHQLKDVNDLLRILYKHDETMIDPISKDVFRSLLKGLTTGKAEDINNCAVEHVIYASDFVQDIVRESINGITLDWSEYSDALFNTVVATMLYKQKNKPRENPMSYRRISVGSIFQKILDRYLTTETNFIAKEAQGNSQYGFSADVNFLQLTVLRENVQKIAEETGKLMICLATDISDAFSQTTREAQLYECYRAGEKGKIWLYSDATYSETYTVIKDSIKKIGNLIKEEKGSRQGGVKSAIDFKIYYLMLDRLIRWADLGYKVDEMDEKLYLQLVADDSMSWVSTPEELQAVIELFELYADRYKMEFCFPKTLINCYGKKEEVDAIRSSTNIKIAGNKPNFPEESLHLGLLQCQDNSKTEIINVRQRKKKTGAKLMTMFGDRFASDIPLRMSLNKTIWNTYLKPTLLTGLSALVIKDDSMRELKQFQDTVIRRMFKVRNKASVTPLMEMAGIENIEASLHKQVFSLFYNFWLNPKTPSSKLIKTILENPQKYTANYWPNHVRDLCQKYSIPSPLTLLTQKIPTKDGWKKYVAEKINSFHHKEMQDKIDEMSTASYLVDEKRGKFNKTGRQFLSSPDTLDDIRAANIKSLFLADEYPTGLHESRVRGRRDDPGNCKFCATVGNDIIDNIPHALEVCPLANKDDVTSTWDSIVEQSAQILGTCTTPFSSYFRRNPGAKTTFILNPNHTSLPSDISIKQHQTSPKFLNTLSRYVFLVHLHRLRFNKSLSDSRKNGANVECKSNGCQTKTSKGKSQTNKITKYLSNANTQKVYSDAKDVSDSIATWERRGFPTNSDHPHQLINIIVCPGVATVQGTVMWPETPGRTIMGRNTILRTLPIKAEEAGYRTFNGCLEIYSSDENIIKNLHITTTNAFTKRELNQLILASPDVVNAEGCPGLRNSNSDELVTVALITTIVKGKVPLRVMDLGRNPYVPKAFITWDTEIDRASFSDNTDFNWINNSRFVGVAAFVENMMDWRGSSFSDHQSTLMITGRDNGDEETDRMINTLRTLADHHAQKYVVSYMTPCPTRDLYTATTGSFFWSMEKQRPYLSDDLFSLLSHHHERLRQLTLTPENFPSFSFQIQSQLGEILAVTREVKKAIDGSPPPAGFGYLSPDDARHKLNGKKRNPSDGNTINISSSSSSGMGSETINVDTSSSSSSTNSSASISPNPPGQLPFAVSRPPPSGRSRANTITYAAAASNGKTSSTSLPGGKFKFGAPPQPSPSLAKPTKIDEEIFRSSASDDDHQEDGLVTSPTKAAPTKVARPKKLMKNVKKPGAQVVERMKRSLRLDDDITKMAAAKMQVTPTRPRKTSTPTSSPAAVDDFEKFLKENPAPPPATHLLTKKSHQTKKNKKPCPPDAREDLDATYETLDNNPDVFDAEDGLQIFVSNEDLVFDSGKSLTPSRDPRRRGKANKTTTTKVPNIDKELLESCKVMRYALRHNVLTPMIHDFLVCQLKRDLDNSFNDFMKEDVERYTDSGVKIFSVPGCPCEFGPFDKYEHPTGCQSDKCERHKKVSHLSDLSLSLFYPLLAGSSPMLRVLPQIRCEDLHQPTFYFQYCKLSNHLMTKSPMTPVVPTTSYLLIYPCFYPHKSKSINCEIFKTLLSFLYSILFLSVFYHFTPERYQCIDQTICSHKTTGSNLNKLTAYISALICYYNLRISNNNRMRLHSKCLSVLQQQSDGPAAPSPSTKAETTPKKITKTSYLIVIFIFLLFLSRQNKTPMTNNKIKHQPQQMMMKIKFLSR